MNQEIINNTVDLNDLICPAFADVFNRIVNCEVDRAVLKGGRNSTKSQTVATAIVTGCMVYNESAVCLVKYSNKINERLASSLRSAINYLGVGSSWRERKSPQEFVLLSADGKETDVSIKLAGCDDPENLKSYRSRRGGGFRYVWFEEATNFTGINEVNSVVQTMARGKGDHVVIFTYNPDKRSKHWCNKEWPNKQVKRAVIYEKEYSLFGELCKQIVYVHHSTYLDVVAAGHSDWIGKEVLDDIKVSEKENPAYYKWAYLGESDSVEARVFPNVREWDGTLPESALIWKKQKYRGLDFGYGGSDPTAFVRWIYDEKNKYLYLDHAFGRPKMGLAEISDKLRACNRNGFVAMSDSANPLMIREINLKLNSYGFLKGAPKPQNSIVGGIVWLQSLNGIFINKNKYPEVWDEFAGYEYLLDRDGELTNNLPDKDNHYIDATRYALVSKILHP